MRQDGQREFQRGTGGERVWEFAGAGGRVCEILYNQFSVRRQKHGESGLKVPEHPKCITVLDDEKGTAMRRHIKGLICFSIPPSLFTLLN